MQALPVTAFTATTALGHGNAAQWSALSNQRSGLAPNDFTDEPLATHIGCVADLDTPLDGHFAEYDCRNNRLAERALAADGFADAVAGACARYGADRVALAVGTSTASIGETEDGYRDLDENGHFRPDRRRPIVHTPHSLGRFVAERLGLGGPQTTIATACSSSAKVFAQAARLIRLDLADAVVVGGVDSLCASVLFGFNALGLVAPEPCQPFDRARAGISIGEAGGFALVERGGAGPQLSGYGESSDAHHMSSPHPEGLGARIAIESALARAGLTASDIGHANLHGTATPANDSVEAALVASMFPATLAAASTKSATGHTLGAAGIIEAVFALLALERSVAIGTIGLTDPDPLCGPQIRAANEARPFNHVLSTSFGFGGNNAALVFSRAGAT